MSCYVIDSSVAIKWFTQEDQSSEAIRLQTIGIPLHAPEFIDVELAAIAWKKIRRDGLSRSEADFIVSQLPRLAITRHPTAPLIASAFDLADRSGRTVYDCLYLTLAVHLGGTFVTADEKLVNSLATTAWAGHVLKLKDVP